MKLVAIYFAGEIDFRKIDHPAGDIRMTVDFSNVISPADLNI